jgi:hypothetical protein
VTAVTTLRFTIWRRRFDPFLWDALTLVDQQENASAAIINNTVAKSALGSRTVLDDAKFDAVAGVQGIKKAVPELGRMAFRTAGVHPSVGSVT